MDSSAFVDSLRILGVSRGATAADVRAAFRRMAKETHPDSNRDVDTTRRFIEIVRAYRTLQQEMEFAADGRELRICPACRRPGEILESPTGVAACADCLLGETERRRFLPLLPITVVKHLSVIACYAAGTGLMYVACSAVITQDFDRARGLALAAIVLIAAGMLILAITCWRLKNTS